MKQLIIVLAILMPAGLFAQTNFKTNNGFAAEGYDVVAYFAEKVQKGNSKFITEYGGAKFKFVNESNLKKFKSAPEKYAPQYGGYCAYAMGKTGEKVSIDPKTYEVRDGKLYLFYNAFFTNTFEKWQEEGAEALQQRADVNWEKIKS